MLAAKQTVCYSLPHPLGLESRPGHSGPHREAPGLVRRQRESWGNLGKTLPCGLWDKTG